MAVTSYQPDEGDVDDECGQIRCISTFCDGVTGGAVERIRGDGDGKV